MNNQPRSILDSMFLGKQEEAQELLEAIEENAYELVANLRDFHTRLQEVEGIREELGLLSN